MRYVSNILITLSLTTLISVCGAIAPPTQSNEIYVDYEYGDLKEVIVGVPFNIYPDFSVAKWVQEAIKVVPETEAKKVMQRSGNDSIKCTPLSRQFYV